MSGFSICTLAFLYLHHSTNVTYFSFILILLQGKAGKLETFRNQRFSEYYGSTGQKGTATFFSV